MLADVDMGSMMSLSSERGGLWLHHLFLYAVFRYNAEKVIPIRDSGKYATLSPCIGKVTVL